MKKAAQQLQVEVVHYPTLKTVLAIEEEIREAETALTRSQLLARLENRVMRSTLNVALEYMEQRGLILETKNGFIWTFNPNRKLAEAEENALEV